ncbi:MAG: sigma-70 family RNA polymerase sigma factor [Candidatus Krumholzibacteriia bacterium]
MNVARHDSPATLALWKGLVGQALRVGVPYEEARDLASQALLKALEAFDGGRGEFGPFCRTILANLVRNHWRDRKPTEPHDPETDPRAAADDPFADICSREVRELMRDLADRLLAVLEPPEAAFFLALAEVAREAETVAVTAAARRLGLEPLKGWDLFRRIQRTARRLQAPPSFMVSAARLAPPAPPSILRSPVVTDEQARDDGFASPPPARSAAGSPALLLLAGCASAGFGDFAATLAPAARARLAELAG